MPPKRRRLLALDWDGRRAPDSRYQYRGKQYLGRAVDTRRAWTRRGPISRAVRALLELPSEILAIIIHHVEQNRYLTYRGVGGGFWPNHARGGSKYVNWYLTGSRGREGESIRVFEGRYVKGWTGTERMRLQNEYRWLAREDTLF